MQLCLPIEELILELAKAKEIQYPQIEPDELPLEKNNKLKEELGNSSEQKLIQKEKIINLFDQALGADNKISLEEGLNGQLYFCERDPKGNFDRIKQFIGALGDNFEANHLEQNNYLVQAHQELKISVPIQLNQLLCKFRKEKFINEFFIKQHLGGRDLQEVGPYLNKNGEPMICCLALNPHNINTHLGYEVSQIIVEQLKKIAEQYPELKLHIENQGINNHNIDDGLGGSLIESYPKYRVTYKEKVIYDENSADDGYYPKWLQTVIEKILIAVQSEEERANYKFIESGSNNYLRLDNPNYNYDLNKIQNNRIPINKKFQLDLLKDEKDNPIGLGMKASALIEFINSA